MSKEMPTKVRNRLVKYFRILREFREKGIERVKSKQLANEMRFEEDIDASTVRRDLAYLGCNGRQGFGYHVVDLCNLIADEIGIGHQEEMILIGVGHMGTALLKYNNFNNKIGRISIAFDLFEEMRVVEGVPVYHIKHLAKYFRPEHRIAILAIPNKSAREVAQQLADLGIRIIINYSNDMIVIRSQKVRVQNIDLNFFIQEAIFSLRLY